MSTEKKKIYIVETSVPTNTGGGQIRNRNLIKQLIKRADVSVEVFCIDSEKKQVVYEDAGSDLGVTLHVIPGKSVTLLQTARAIMWGRVMPTMESFKDSGLGTVFRKRCEESLPEVVQIEQLQAYYCIRPHIPWLKERGVKIIFDCHNVESMLFQESLGIFSFPKKLVGVFLVPNLKKMEIEAAMLADTVLACSESDAHFFKMHNAHTRIVPNGVDCSEFENITRGSTPTLIFIGGSAYPPNADAVEFYLSNMHQNIKSRVPDIRLLIVGVDTAWLDARGIHDPSVQALGHVPDIRPNLQEAAVALCPLRYGSGTRIKILTYMAAGLPVVSTSKGAEGVGYVVGDTILVSDTPEEFAENVLKLLSDTAYADAVAQRGRNFVLRQHDWNVIGKDIMSAYAL